MLFTQPEKEKITWKNGTAMYDVTSTNGHSEDYYQVPLKKNLKLENEENNNTTFNTQEKWRKYDGEKEVG